MLRSQCRASKTVIFFFCGQAAVCIRKSSVCICNAMDDHAVVNEGLKIEQEVKFSLTYRKKRTDNGILREPYMNSTISSKTPKKDFLSCSKNRELEMVSSADKNGEEPVGKVLGRSSVFSFPKISEL